MIETDSSQVRRLRVGQKVFMLVGALVTIGCLYLAFAGIRWDLLWSEMKQASPGYILLGFLLQLAAVGCMAFRWKVELSDEGVVSYRDAFSSVSSSIFFNNYIPLRIGDLIRSFLMARKTNQSRIQVLSVLFVERLIDFTVVLLLAAFSLQLLLTVAAIELSALILVASILGGIFLGLFLLYRVNSREWIRLRVIGGFPEGPRRFLEGLLDRIVKGLQSFQSSFRLLQILLWTVGIWVCHMAGSYAWTTAFGLGIPPGGIVLLVSMLNLATLLPSSPGGIGLYHQVAIWALSPWVPLKEEALAFGTVTHGLIALQGLMLGIFTFLSEGISFNQLTRQA
ncbi:MAG: flippase-like domain-containing protein, partial [Leptospiraceae bacterium]|nr:flippase-like domain-containing protein [Leptospiraceae bacterium]